MEIQQLISQIKEAEGKNRELEQKKTDLKDEVHMSEERVKQKYERLQNRLTAEKDRTKRIKQDICDLEAKRMKLNSDEKLLDKLLEDGRGEVVGDEVILGESHEEEVELGKGRTSSEHEEDRKKF